MKISRSLTVKITGQTFICSCDSNNHYACTFMEDGESLSISFDPSCLHKLSDLIQKLQSIQQKLMEEKRKQLLKEIELLHPHSPLLPINSNGKTHPEAEIAF